MIRNYVESDFEMLDSWWKAADEIAPLRSMVPADSTYVAEIGGTPAAAVSLILTNVPEYCYAENFVANPQFSPAERAETIQLLSEHVDGLARRMGYKRVACFSYKESVGRRYTELGYRPTVSGVTAFVKELK